MQHKKVPPIAVFPDMKAVFPDMKAVFPDMKAAFQFSQLRLP